MSTDTKLLQQATDLKQLPLPAHLHILSMEAEDYTTWDGDPALSLLVVIDEDTDLFHLPTEEIMDFKRAVHDSLQKHGISLFPYFTFAKPSELAETDED
jgi:hypothetical protein